MTQTHPDVAGRDADEERVQVNETRTQSQQLGAIRDLGDVIEIPIVEEELVVTKRLVVKEVLRIRKRWVTTQRTIESTLRKEDIEIVEEGDITVHRQDRQG